MQVRGVPWLGRGISATVLLTLGVFRDLTDSYAPDFVLLSAFALGCALFLGRVPALGVSLARARDVEQPT